MNICYWGHSCFKITSAQGTSIVTDPYTGIGYELPSGLSADAVTISHAHFDHNFIQAVQMDRVISTIGAHLVADIQILGIPSWHDEKRGALRGSNIIYKYNVDGITICHLGDLGEDISAELVERIGMVDVLLLPVGGTYTVDALGAKKYIDCLQPKVVIPMHYKPEDGALDIAPIHTFLSLYSPRDIQFVQDGVLEIDKQTQGIFYLERAKTI